MNFAKGTKEPLSAHFSPKEFDCPCDKCDSTEIDLELIKRLETMRDLAKAPIYINSGYRCANHQAELRAKGFETARGVSTHELGQAADICTDLHCGLELAQLAANAGFTSVGTGLTWIHVDTRPGLRSWSYFK